MWSCQRHGPNHNKGIKLGLWGYGVLHPHQAVANSAAVCSYFPNLWRLGRLRPQPNELSYRCRMCASALTPYQCGSIMRQWALHCGRPMMVFRGSAKKSQSRPARLQQHTPSQQTKGRVIVYFLASHWSTSRQERCACSESWTTTSPSQHGKGAKPETLLPSSSSLRLYCPALEA
jgi:hypothetical protein